METITVIPEQDCQKAGEQLTLALENLAQDKRSQSHGIHLLVLWQLQPGPQLVCAALTAASIWSLVVAPAKRATGAPGGVTRRVTAVAVCGST